MEERFGDYEKTSDCGVSGALRDLEDDTPIYIYSTINLYCSSALINELIEAYREENAEDEAGKEDIYTNFDE